MACEGPTRFQTAKEDPVDSAGTGSCWACTADGFRAYQAIQPVFIGGRHWQLIDAWWWSSRKLLQRKRSYVSRFEAQEQHSVQDSPCQKATICFLGLLSSDEMYDQAEICPCQPDEKRG